MLDISSHLTFRIHSDADGRLTLQFRQLFEKESNPDRWQYDHRLDDQPEDVVARLREIATQVMAGERDRLDRALNRLRDEPAKQRKSKR
jgi:hypothetical protein